MIKGTGIDIVEIKRMEHWLTNAKLLERFFHADEISYSLSRGKNAAHSLAARFAAKEAFAKALGTGLKNMALNDIMVFNSASGRPEIRLFGSAKKKLEESGAQKVHVSLSHEKENAVAMIILEEA
ncbi:MAG: holo-ACP synthase [Treponema sp.]|nr:holo-ACP synthase [Treponema sp.]